MSVNYTNPYNTLSGGAQVIPGFSGEMLSAWAMLRPNAKAYKALQTAEKNGGVMPKATDYVALNSDKLLNEYYDPKTNKIKKATYTPVSNATKPIKTDENTTMADVITNMRTLALSAISNPNNLGSTHYDMFEQMRATIANGLNTKSASDKTEVVTEEAKAAVIEKPIDYHLLTDDESFTVAGKDGETTYRFGAGDSIEDIAAKISADSDTHGVSASVVEGEDGTKSLRLESLEKGAQHLIRVDQKVGSLFADAGSSISAKGKDEVKELKDTAATSEKSQAAMAGGLWSGKLFEDVKFTISGPKGEATYSFDKGTEGLDIIKAINADSENTGVTAELIRNEAGEIEGIGLLTEKAGTGNNIRVDQDKGNLFAAEGRAASVAGSSKGKTSNGASITSLQDLGKVKVGDETYSFADLVQGGRASIQKNPDAALAVIDQALKDIYSGRAEVSGFEKNTIYVPGLDYKGADTGNATNTHRYGFDDSAAITNWLKKYETATATE
ncbi:MAG: hypothetical protein LIQ31_02015 [Planctomycetes bacterium]|nr:hypothetical protein [Planctomycetota bacterium]